MKYCSAALAFLISVTSQAQIIRLNVTGMNVNRQENPVGVSVNETPTLGWMLESRKGKTYQVAYDLKVSCNRDSWSSGKVQSSQSYGIKPQIRLYPDTEYSWSVVAWDNYGNKSERVYSSFRTGLGTDDWKAKWIGQKEASAPVSFRNTLVLRSKVKRATAYITSHGVYEASIAGRKLGDGFLSPGWTSYGKRLQYQAYDVTSVLVKGKNAVEVTVAPGWYGSGMRWGRPDQRFKYGNDLMLLMQVNVEYADGTKQTFVTDGAWEMSPSQVTFSTIYDGETVDHNVRPDWTPAVEHNDIGYGNLISTEGNPVTVKKVFKPVGVITTPKGEKVIDFGQNIVGWERVVLKGHKGDTVRITHAEILDGDGNFYTANLRTAKATSTYVLDGEGREVFEPRFTFYGFRYICVDGLKGELKPEDFEAVAVSSAGLTGSFTCSDPLINQLQNNIEWSFMDNFVDIPTDCPQRDERLGWTGDAQVFFPTAAFLDSGVDRFFRKWLADLAVDQRESGSVPRVIPDVFPESVDRLSATGWADAATIIPWEHYLRFGDVSILQDQYASMKAWVDYMVAESKDRSWLWNNEDRHFGDWLAFTPTDVHFVAQCFYANSVDILVKTAAVLGRAEDEEYYRDVYNKVVAAFRKAYIKEDGLLSQDTQTAYVLALKFNLFQDRAQSMEAFHQLVRLIKANNNHISTGFLGTPYICDVLSSYGYVDMAYTLLFQKTCPSWIYPISKGATTIWERWDSIQEDGSIIQGMNSFNHYSYGAIGNWLYEWALGIRPVEPGYKVFTVQPHAGGGMTSMEGSTMTPYGKISVKWTAKDNVIQTLDLDVPANTTARIVVSPKHVLEVGSGTYKLSPQQ